MKETCFRTWMLIWSLFYISAYSGQAQAYPMASNEKMPLSKALQKVGKNYNAQFVYEKSLVDSKSAVYDETKMKGKSIEEALKSILYPNDLVFLYVKQNYYSIVGKGQLHEAAREQGIATAGQSSGSSGVTVEATANVKSKNSDQVVRGKVTDANGKPVGGASVSEKGKGNSTVTDANGEFVINVGTNATLIFSSIGFSTIEVPVNGQAQINVSLKEEVRSINEVVVTGYTNQRKKDITGAVSVVDMNAFKSVPAGTAEQALQGQASGVNVISSGAPGGRNDIFIRGVTSFGNSQPLIVVDGVQGSLTDLNTNDIASIQVLKDAGAAAIYGVRGSNGVIVITTKKGRVGQPTISFDSYYGVQTPAKGNVFNLLNSSDYATLFKQVNPGTVLFANGLPDYTYAGPGSGGTAMKGDPAVDPSRYNFDPSNPENDYLIQQVNKTGTDWYHEIFKPAPMMSHTLTASGGSDKATYLFSMGYLDQKGTLINTYLKRYSMRVNTEFKISKNIKIGENVYLYYKQNPDFSNQQEGNAVSLAYRNLPIIPVYDISGVNYGGTWLGPELGTTANPVAQQRRTSQNKNNYWDVIGNVYAEVNFLKHFTARSSFGGVVDHQSTHNFRFNTYNDKESHTSYNGYNQNAFYKSSYTFTNTLNYSNTFGDHNLKVLVGSEAISNYGESLGGASTGFFSTDPNYLFLNNGTSNVTNYSSAYINNLFSLFGRLDYTYKDRYLLAATVRRDGSSVFGADKRYGIFPSFSLGWRISNEAFMKNVTFVNDLKLRGSYGILGSYANVDPANAFTLYSSGFGTSYYDITGSGSTQQGFFQSRNGNPNTGWEQDVITNVGLDGSFFNYKLDFSVEWYKKSINGLLFPQPLPATAGNAAPPTINIGDIQNRGWDFNATYHGSVSNDLKYNIGFNLTTYKNLVVKIPDPGYFDVADSRIGTLVRNQVGHPVGSFFGYDVIGIFKDDAEVNNAPGQTDAAPGRFRYRDVNGDGQITPEDRTFFGNPNPKFTYGLNLGLNYKNLDFSAIFYGSQGNDNINFVRYYTDFFGTSEGKGKSNVLKDAWTPQNTGAKTPIAEYASTFSTNGAFNSYYLEDGSFLKLRSLVVGYRFPSSLMKRFNMSKFRIYLQATNLFTITKYSGIDPELVGSLYGTTASSSFGIDYGNYPNNQRSLLFGLGISF